MGNSNFKLTYWQQFVTEHTGFFWSTSIFTQVTFFTNITIYSLFTLQFVTFCICYFSNHSTSAKCKNVSYFVAFLIRFFMRKLKICIKLVDSNQQNVKDTKPKTGQKAIAKVILCLCIYLFRALTCWSCKSVWHMLVLKSSCLCSWLTCSCHWHDPSANESSEAQRRFSCRRAPACWLTDWFKLLDCCCCCLALVLFWRCSLLSPEKAGGGFRLLKTKN